MHNQQNILVTGGTGLIGHALKQVLPQAMYISSNDDDLTQQLHVEKLFKYNKFDTVIHLAARVGGLHENIAHPAEFYTQNILMNTNVLHAAYTNGVTNFIGVLSTCIYPDAVEKYPLTEDMMHT